MTAKPTIKRSVPVGSSNKGPTALSHVTVGNARQTASRHCPDQSKSWTLNELTNLKIYTYDTRGITEDNNLDQPSPTWAVISPGDAVNFQAGDKF